MRRLRPFTIQLLIMLLLSVLMIGCSKQLEQGGDMGMNEKPAATISGEDIAALMLDGKYKELYNQFSTELKEVISLKDFEAIGNDFVQGEAFDVVSTFEANEYQFIIWNNQKAERKGIHVVMDQQQHIVGIQVQELASYPETDEQYSETIFQLPFQEEWFVFWGGKDIFLNYHYEYDEVRYAYDFVQVKDSYSYEGDPLLNESYYSFDQPVLAPAAGTVIAVVDGIEDNIPGDMNAAQPEGNMVVIEHEHGEKSMLAHFKKDSIVVKVGDKVEAGQLLGTCGNSGNSSEPHIHFQVSKQQDDGSELVIPVSFAGGKQWVRGDIAQP